jgi:hypothetical protein
MAIDSDDDYEPNGAWRSMWDSKIEKGIKERDNSLRLAAAQLAIMLFRHGVGQSVEHLLTERPEDSDNSSEADFVESTLTEAERDALPQAMFVVQAIYKASQVEFPTNAQYYGCSH